MSEKIGAAPTGRPDDSAARRTHWRGAARPDQYAKHTNGLLGSIPDSYIEREVEEGRAIVRLMAAAPELLEALRGMVALEEENLRSSDDIDVCFELESARAAIAKATGVASSVAQAAQGEQP